MLFYIGIWTHKSSAPCFFVLYFPQGAWGEEEDGSRQDLGTLGSPSKGIIEYLANLITTPPFRCTQPVNGSKNPASWVPGGCDFYDHILPLGSNFSLLPFPVCCLFPNFTPVVNCSLKYSIGLSSLPRGKKKTNFFKIAHSPWIGAGLCWQLWGWSIDLISVFFRPWNYVRFQYIFHWYN